MALGDVTLARDAVERPWITPRCATKVSSSPTRQHRMLPAAAAVLPFSQISTTADRLSSGVEMKTLPGNTNAHTLRTPKHGGLYRNGRRCDRDAAAAFQHNARTHSGPPSTGITVTMDGGVADTARANTTA